MANFPLWNRFKRAGRAFTKGHTFHSGSFGINHANPTDRRLKESAEAIIWGRKISPRLLWGIYDTESWVAACVDEITAWVMADGIDIVPTVKNPSQEQKNTLIEFLDEPNPEDTVQDIMEDQLNGLLVLGDDTAEIVRDPVSGTLLELWSMDTTQIEIVTDTNKLIIGYQRPIQGKKAEEWPAEDIFRLKRNARGKTLFGASPLRPLFLGVTTGLFAQAWNRNRFENGGTARKAFVFDEDMSAEQVEWNDAHLKEMKGVENAGQNIVLWGKATIEDVDSSAQDMDYKGQINDSRDRILAVYRVPPRILGIIEAGGVGGGKGDEQRKKFLRSPINPLKRMMGRNWTKRVAVQELEVTDWKIVLPTEDVEDDLDRANTEKVYIETGIKLVDESRAKINLPPLDEVSEDANPRTENKDAPENLKLKGTAHGRVLKKAPDLDSLKAEDDLEIVPSPHIPNLAPAVLKMRAGIKSVLRRWRGRVLLRFDRLTRTAKNQRLGLLSMGKLMFNNEVAKEWFQKQDINPDLFMPDVEPDDMRVTLAASMSTAARAGIVNAVKLGGADTDDAFAAAKVFIDQEAAKLAGQMSAAVRSGIADTIVDGVREGLPVKEIRNNIESAFDSPKTVQVATFERADGTVVPAHTRQISVDAYSEMVARTESARMSNEAALRSFNAAGITKLRWRTARFRVDEKICKPLDGKIFELEEVIGKSIIPAHPHCRCAFVPVVEEGEVEVNAVSADVERNRLES